MIPRRPSVVGGLPADKSRTPCRVIMCWRFDVSAFRRFDVWASSRFYRVAVRTIA